MMLSIAFLNDNVQNIEGKCFWYGRSKLKIEYNIKERENLVRNQDKTKGSRKKWIFYGEVDRKR